jgi:very-short-patch-repair endonuclease
VRGRRVLSHYSAAALWGLVAWDGRHPEVTVPGPAAHVRPGLRVHRSSRLAAEDHARRDGVPVTAPARTLVDLAGMLGPRPLRRAVREAQARHVVDVRQILQALDRLGPRPGSAKLARIVATDPAPTRSELEDVVLDLLVRAGLEHPDVNVPLELDGHRVVPDFRWARERLVVEADGAAWHDHRIAREDDAERQALLERHGERVLRVTWRQAVARPRETLARIRAAGAPARGSRVELVPQEGTKSTRGVAPTAPAAP